jgi:hypothetical protein
MLGGNSGRVDESMLIMSSWWLPATQFLPENA